MSRFRLRRYKFSLALTHGASVTTASSTAPTGANSLNGMLRGVVFLTPSSVDGSATATIQVIDSDGFTLYSTSAGVAAATKKVDILSTPIPIANVASIQVTFSANQTSTDSTTTGALLIET